VGSFRSDLSRRAGQVLAATSMRLLQSKTAVVTKPMSTGSWTNFTPSAQSVKLGLHIIDGERDVRDTVGNDPLF
jgi:hypothetical protein